MELGTREWHEILDAAHNGILAVNRESRVIVFNRAAAELVGCVQTEAFGRRLEEIIPNTRLAEVMESGKPEYGQPLPLRERVIVTNRSPIWRAHKIIGAVAVFQDITDIEALSQELETVRRAHADLDAVIESVDDGIVVANAHGYIVRANQAYLRIAGIARDEFVGKHFSELFKQGYLNRSVSQMVLERRARVNVVDVRNGKELLMTGTPVFDEKGELSRVVTAVRDISELSELKARLAESEEKSERYYNELEHLRSRQSFRQILTKNQEMLAKVEMAFHVAKVDSTVLILGESGVGKELVAGLIHRAGSRSKNPFITINCGAIPLNLLESELFGYEKGAFTGAQKEGKPGLFELAQGGTLFLDEVGELPLELQVKVLRALQDREITRLGGSKPIRLDVRFVAATNRDLEEMVREKTFREDLFYRLNVVPILIPPLRRRKEDIPLLVNEFLRRFNTRYGLQKWITPEVMGVFMLYDWPGNIRELENTVERLMVTGREDAIGRESMEDVFSPGGLKMAEAGGLSSFQKVGHGELPEFPGQSGGTFSLPQYLKEEERRLISEAYAVAGSTRKAAALLKISQSSLVKKMQKYRVRV
ncbi:sigma 54-interacting transcriptional regulator [Acididesulfobacillus acetoxydans]|uniref:sigma 54-interacting transcriptional regulator n=1 Tax=Acididesulfobacillus acetoxydans TaxID=1561005 RepID=UPI001F100F0A|nr:sigma 54-interacting transcriptional regulator [Acididesulfobacillus acetoxydans]